MNLQRLKDILGGQNPEHRWVMMFGLWPFLLIGSLGSVYFPELPGRQEAAVFFNLLIAAPAFYGLIVLLGKIKGLLCLFLLSIFGYLIEGTGVVTGWPYGAFSYADALGIKIFDIVPVLLPFSWVPLVIGAFSLAGRDGFAGGCLGVLWLTAFDGVLDPGAVSLGYWNWHHGGIYYGVPLTNYAGWLLSSTIALCFLALCYSGRIGQSNRFFLGLSYHWSLVFWTFVCLWSGLWLPFLLGFSLILLSTSKILGGSMVIQLRSFFVNGSVSSQ